MLISFCSSLGKLGDSASNTEENKVEFIKSSNYFPTVFDVIRSAGGITQFSNLEEVELVRIKKLSGNEKVVSVIKIEDNIQ